MNLSKRDQNLLLILLGIVVFILAWTGVRNKFNAKAQAEEAQISALEPRLTELRNHRDNVSIYERGIEEIAATVKSEMKKFPNDVRAEDMIMYASGLEKTIGLSVGSISFMPPELLSQFNVPTEGKSGTELLAYAAFKTGLSIDCELDYSQMKKFISQIYSTPQRTTLESLSVSYNSETAGLTGSATLAKYFLSGEKYVYTPTTVPNVIEGTTNPFGTTNRVTESPKPSSDPN